MRVPAVYPAKGPTIRKLIGGRGRRGSKKYIELGKFKRKKGKKPRQKTPSEYIEDETTTTKKQPKTPKNT